MKKLILIVCNGNIHRSVIAEQCINNALRQNGLDEKYLALSRGIQGTCDTNPVKCKNLRDYELEWKLTSPALEEVGVMIPVDQIATPVDEYIVYEATVIFAMEKSVLLTKPNNLVRQFPSSGFKMRLFSELDGKTDDVPDCFGNKDPNFHRRTVLMINTIVKSHINYLIALVEILTIQKERITQNAK